MPRKDTYDFKIIEQKWQKYWKENKFFSVKKDSSKPKYYLLEMFPYPSGKLHMGHMRNYAIGDTMARFLRRKGYNVLYPMGYDALGLPAENAAILNKIHPRAWTENSIKVMMEQQKKMGLSYDWERLVATCYPEYYHWNQWMFIKFYEKGLAYKKRAPINWCPKCGTVLANEQVVEDGRCWRCEAKVEIRDLEQWFFRITAYAEELLKDLDKLEEWPERVKLMQRNWIGKSVGTMVNFPLKGSTEVIPIFTTRPDTLYGVTFMTFAPEHPQVPGLIKGTPYEKKVKDFINKVVLEDRFSRTSLDKEKEGVFIGRYAVNPLNGEEIPIYVANFVLLEYGTGAIMAVPAHDQRDFEFAKKYNIPVKVVINPPGRELRPEEMEQAYGEPGVLTNSDLFDGTESNAAIEKISGYVEERNFGNRSTQYRLRDWLISRQRYWGTPIPIVYCKDCGTVPVPEKDLPVLLPEKVEFTGEGNPLSKAGEFTRCRCPKCNREARRETDTMDTFVDSSWYFARYCSPGLRDKPFDSADVQYWMPVDQYIGGIEHAVMHLLYARFFTKALRDLGLYGIDEPFKRLLCQGMVIKDGAKMSKSKGNVVSVDEMTRKYGADTARLFILFASPPEFDLEWSEEGVNGSYRFLNRVWRLMGEAEDLQSNREDAGDEKELRRVTHGTIKKVSEDIQRGFHFNTAISAIMELVNALYDLRQKVSPSQFRESFKTVLLLLAPFAPHICEEMWQRIGYKQSISKEPWPEYEENFLLKDDKIIVIQVNGKLRGRITVPSKAGEEEIKEKALSNEKVKPYLKDAKVGKIVYVPDKLVNVVLKQ